MGLINFDRHSAPELSAVDQLQVDSYYGRFGLLGISLWSQY